MEQAPPAQAARMSPTEAIMWTVEKDPALRSDFCNLTLLERRPTDARLRASLARGVAAIPRLRQRVIGAPLRMVPPEFAEDPTLDIDAHIRVVAVPAPGGERELLDLCGALAEQPLDRARPLWEFTLIEGLAGGRAALLQKVHHTISDGEGALRLSLALVDFEPDPVGSGVAPVPAPAPRYSTPLGVTRHAVADATARNVDFARNGIAHVGRVIARPTELPARSRDVLRLLGSLQRQAIVTDHARSDVLVRRSLRRYFAIRGLPMSRFRDTATKLGGTINDAYITGLASALGRYHERFGSEQPELRLAMPVSTRARGDQRTNQFVPARVVVPIQPAHDPVALFGAIHELLTEVRGEVALSAADAFAGVLAFLPTSVLVAMTRTQSRTIDFAASNLRGSPVPLFLAGARILANHPFGPRTGAPLNVTMLSYGDDVHFGYNIDPAAIADPTAFMRDVDDAYDALPF
jgi:WS/DGAT/MGAT family acyltransferase